MIFNALGISMFSNRKRALVIAVLSLSLCSAANALSIRPVHREWTFEIGKYRFGFIGYHVGDQSCTDIYYGLGRIHVNHPIQSFVAEASILIAIAIGAIFYVRRGGRNRVEQFSGAARDRFDRM